VDIKRENYINPLRVTQNDAVTFVLYVTDDGEPFDLSGVSTFALVSVRPDKQPVQRAGVLTGANQVTFNLGTTEISVLGRVDAVIQLYDADGRVSSIPFTYKVLKDLSIDYILSENEKTLLEVVLGEGPLVIQQAKTATTNANNAVTNLNTAVNNLKLEYKAPVANFAALSTTYTNPQIGWIAQTINDGKFYRWNGTAWAFHSEMNSNILTDIQNKLSQSERQTSILSQGVSVVNGEVNAPVSVEIEGRTLVSLGNTPLQTGKNYVVADKKTSVIVDSVTHKGVAKFTKTGEDARPIIIRTANFEGKVAGSVVENPHKSATVNNATTLKKPTDTWVELTSSYPIISKLDVTSLAVTANLTTSIAQQLFSFNLIEEVERNIGRIPRATVADKVAWLKANVSKIVANWHGYGSSVGGNKATLAVWYSPGAYINYGSIITGGVSILKGINNTESALNSRIQSDGFIHFLAYAEPSDGIIPSIINTDYIELEIELLPDADFTHPKVPLYEVNDSDYNKILLDWNADEVVNRYPVVEGVQHLQGVGVIAEGDNLLPPFSEWVLHANAKVISPYELELNATAPSVFNRVNINVTPGASYFIKCESIGNFIVNSISDTGVETSIISNRPIMTVPFTVPPNINRIIVYFGNSAITGTFTFKNPMLTLGSVAKPFVPRNPSYVIADIKLGAIGDKKDILYQQDGRWLLRKSVEKDVVLDGSLAWAHRSDKTGYKIVQYPLVGVIRSTEIVSKHDGKKVKAIFDFSVFTETVDNSYSDNVLLVLTVSDLDTGFGETYTPSVAEIKAYFYGYQMNSGTFGTNYDGTGTKTWIPIGDLSNVRAVTIVPTFASPSQLDGTVQPYKLSYALAKPQIIDVTDKVEGALSVNGLTQVSVDSGYRRTVVDGKSTWTKGSKYDFTVNPTNVKLTYANNIRGAVDDISTVIQDNSTMLSIHEKSLVDLYIRVKALEVQP